MTEFPVHYKLFASNGITEVYTFPYVQSDNSPQDPMTYTEIEGLRGVGSIIIPGSTRAWDLELTFILVGEDYEELINKMDALETTIVPQTRYVLKIDRVSSGSTKSYNVMRLQPFQFNDNGHYRNDMQEVTVILRANCW